MGCCKSLQANSEQQFDLKQNMLEHLSDQSCDYYENVIDLQVKVKEIYKDENSDRKPKSDAAETNVQQQIPEPQTSTLLPTKDWVLNPSYLVRLDSHRNVNDFYDVEDLIGQGGFGKVYKVTHRNTKMVRAMKLISKQRLQKSQEEQMLNETSLLAQIDHPNIVKIFECFKDETNYYLISEFCGGGELFDKLRNFRTLTEKSLALIIKNILSAITYCHKKGIVHRDLKPENILFDQNQNVKIIDFGASTKLQDPSQKLEKRIGTPYYVAPEVLAASYNEKCDIWSIGVILYTMLCGYPPFFAHNEKTVLKKVSKGVYSFDSSDWKKVSIQAKDLIRRMLFYDPNMRISAEDAQNHPWIVSNKCKTELSPNVLSNLCDFQVIQIEFLTFGQLKNKLKHAILEFVSVQVMTSTEKEELRKSFQEMDKNGDGLVSKNELLNAYRQYYGGDKVKAKKVVDSIFHDIDFNKSGKVEFTEFVTASINREKALSKQKIEQAFKFFDLDGNGVITKNEIAELFGGQEIEDDMWKQILLDCDRNKDGMVRDIIDYRQISLLEFISLLENKISQSYKNK